VISSKVDVVVADVVLFTTSEGVFVPGVVVPRVVCSDVSAKKVL